MPGKEHKAISETPRDGLVMRWLDPVLAEALAMHPPYGRLTVTFVKGQPKPEVRVERIFLTTAREAKP